MSHYFVKQAHLKGEISIPPSKSHTLRAILFGSLGKGVTKIHHYLASPDTEAMINACRLFGSKIDILDQTLEIQGTAGSIHSLGSTIYAGNSGIVLRFCSALAALTSHPFIITGDYSICHQRPIKSLLDALSQLGAKVLSIHNKLYAPIRLQGPIHPGQTVISGEDSQPVSAMLIAGAFAGGPIELKVNNPGEKPWVALTLSWFDKLGISYSNQAFERYNLYGHARYSGFEYRVPGDFSSAAFPIAAALITNSEITLKNIDMHDIQGDKELIHVFQKMGANIEIDSLHQTLHVKKGHKLSGITVDINNFIDAVTILAVVACYAEGETLIYNAAVAKTKECNRLYCITKELQKMGADIYETDDGLSIRGSKLKGASVESYQDHRMAMSLTIAGFGAEGETIVSSTACIAKTFPSFKQAFNILGANIRDSL